MVAALVLATFVGADEKETGAAASTNAPSWLKGSSPLHVQMIFATRAGEKKLSRIPYDFDLVADSPQGAVFRVGTEVPVAITRPGKDGERTDWQYRNVGT